jgi:hypothetical protein
LGKQVQELFSYRNRILHVSPEYVEGLGLPEDLFSEVPEEVDTVNVNQSREISDTDLVRNAAFILSPPGEMSLAAAVEHYDIAEEYLRGLITFEKVK